MTHNRLHYLKPVLHKQESFGMAEIWLHPISSPDSVWPTVDAQGLLNALEGKLSNTAAGLELQGGEQSEGSRKRT